MRAWTPQQRLASRREYARLYQHKGGTKVTPITVPDDVTVLETHVPCFACGNRGGCRHRPWLLGDAA